MRYLAVLILVLAVIVSGCSQNRPELKTTPESKATPETKETSRLVYGKEILKTDLPPEDAVIRFLPDLNHTWKLVKSDRGNTLSIPGEIPRVPEVGYIRNVSANINGFLATPLVENGLIFLADSQGVYALSEKNGELVWGDEIYSDSLEGRKIGNPQPWTKWKALGLNRFVEAYGLGKYLYVATSSYLDAGDAMIIALNKTSGEVVWKVEMPTEENDSSRSSTTSNLLVADGEVCAGSVRDEGYIYCFTEDGKAVWKGRIGGNVRGLAYGNGILFATSEGGNSIHAFDIKTGRELWRYTYKDAVSTPLYRDGRILFIGGGKLVAISSNGEFLWEKNIAGGEDVNTNAFLAVGDRIYAPRNIGERPLELYTLNFDGKIAGKFRLEGDERAGAPVVTENVVILPVTGRDYAKIYFLWKGKSKLSEFKLNGDEIFMPKIAISHGKIYAVFSDDRMDGRTNHVIVQFKDSQKPEIRKVEETEHNGSVDVKALIQDKQSGIHRVLIAYRNDSVWHYVEMELARRYVMEPIGGYGFGEEEYMATIPKAEHVIMAIDNSGNYILK